MDVCMAFEVQSNTIMKREAPAENWRVYLENATQSVGRIYQTKCSVQNKIRLIHTIKTSFSCPTFSSSLCATRKNCQFYRALLFIVRFTHRHICT